MRAPFSGSWEGLAIAAGVLALTVIFVWKQWVERRDRETNLSSDDARYYRRKDIRRFFGTSILGLIGIGMVAGSLLNPKTQKLPFLWVWLGVGALVLLSILLAFLDWFANFLFAARHRRLLIEERLGLIEEEFRQRAAGSNGHGETTVP